MARVKSPGESAIETRYLVMPDQVNHYGTAFGGVILSWIDMAAAMVAERHCEGEDNQKRPTQVPGLILETEAEKQRFQEAKLRSEVRRNSC